MERQAVAMNKPFTLNTCSGEPNPYPLLPNVQNGGDLVVLEGASGYYTVTYDDFTQGLNEQIRALTLQINSLTARVESLENA